MYIVCVVIVYQLSTRTSFLAFEIMRWGRTRASASEIGARSKLLFAIVAFYACMMLLLYLISCCLIFIGTHGKARFRNRLDGQTPLRLLRAVALMDERLFDS